LEALRTADACLLLQLLQKILQVKELFLYLNLPILIELEEADTFQEEDVSRLGGKTYPPFDGGFLTTHPDVERVEFELVEDSGERSRVSGDGPTGLHRLRGDLPAGTLVADKTGSGERDDVTRVAKATNDAGIITLPSGRGHLAIAVLISESKLPDAAQEKLIAELARAAYDAYSTDAAK
jgi:hypothetical protein